MEETFTKIELTEENKEELIKLYGEIPEEVVEINHEKGCDE